MSVLIQGYQLREIAFGVQVIKAAQVLPATTTGNLYTVAGGNVLVTSLFGLCSTVCTGTATTLAIGTAPTAGTAKTTGIATATAVTSAEVGTWVGPQISSVVGSVAGSAPFATVPFIVAPGKITLTTSATNTGAFTWYLTYVPLDAGATVS
jgi:hypothetical protein